MSPIPEMDYALLYGERTVRSVANSTRHDVIALLAEAKRIRIRTTTSAYPMEEANEVLLQLERSALDGAAVLVP
jgi:propanol-preferring alcohol dehydrogenase